MFLKQKERDVVVKKVKMFLSSTFEPLMISQRDLFRNELRFRLEMELGQYGIYFYLYDFEMGIPRNTRPEFVIRQCLQAVKASNIFIGIVGKEYGTPIQTFLRGEKERERLKEEYPMLAGAIDRNVSVLEMEFLYALASEHKKKLFLNVNDNSGERNRKTCKLISLIQQSGQKCQEVSDAGQLKDIVIGWVLKEIHESVTKVAPCMMTAYAVRKTKCYVKDRQLSAIYQYLEGASRKILCIYGKKGSGRTVLVSQMYLEQYVPGMCFAFAGCEAYTLSEIILILLKQIYAYYKMPEGEMKNVYSERDYVRLFQETIRKIAKYSAKCCLVIDGIDKIHRMDAVSLNVILPDYLPENVKMILTTNNKSLVSDRKVSFLRHSSVDNYKVIERILWTEGKQGESRRIAQNWIFRKRAKISLEYVYVFITELNASAKYNTVTRTLYKRALQAGGLWSLYTFFLQRMLGRFPGKENYIRKMMLYFVSTENGLTERELELLVGFVDGEILSFVYPYLEITGEQRMLIDSGEFYDAVCRLWKVSEEHLQCYRKNIITVCFQDAKDDPVLGRELLHQLQYIRDKVWSGRILADIQIVDSITYYNEKYALCCLKKLSNFNQILQSWSELEITEENYVCMITIINIELEQEMYDCAQKHLKKMLDLLKQGRIEPNDTGNIYNQLSVLYAKILQYDKAYRYAKEAIRAAQESRENSVQVCECKNLLCRIYLNTGHYVMAYALGRRLLESYANPFFEDAVSSLRIRITLLNSLNKQRRDNEYQKEYVWLMPRLEAAFGKVDSEVMQVRILNIHFLIRRGYLERALLQCRKVWELVEIDSEFKIELLLAECDVYYCLRDWKREAESLKKAGELLRAKRRKGTVEEISWFQKIMCYFIETGKSKEAIKVGKRVQNLLEPCHGAQLWEVDNFLTMGAAYETMGQNQAALKNYENAIQVLKNQRDVFREKEADIYNQMGSCFQNMQFYAKAYKAYRKALDMLQKDSCFQHELYGTILNNMGQLMQETRHEREAMKYYAEALKCYQGYYPDYNMHIATILDNMGGVFDRKEEYKKAAHFHLKGLWYRLKHGGLHTPSTVTSLHNLANTWSLDGRHFLTCITECMAVIGLKNREVSVEDYPIYLCMGQALEHIHFRKLALQYYVRAYHLLSRKKEVVSETAEINLILATFDKDWEKDSNALKKLQAAERLLRNKKNLYRKDYELKIAVYFSMERYYCYHGRYYAALKCLDAAKAVINCNLGEEEYGEIWEAILAAQTEIEDSMARE